ncbi:hypothetical protein, variant 1 [Aphanomyces invadans]|uniref:Secreted protein n=1 Tax=Aphanomyces invadans TaxID=157072 RepID=A0A024UAT4_9STRA|nr:hypothetical protein, variant 1 [Aphanomyces invadans]ETW03369.1 hypothetical protein, variant 1 [Aphanomyces invadans]|eukprot:XP_008867598.1 hypothetical protein, variant 1 [Aphanomyces invadans]
MLVLKKWLHMWFLGHASEEDCHGDGDDAQVRVHVQGDKPEQDVQVLRRLLIPQVIVGTPPPQGCFGKPGLFVQVYVVDAMWADVLERHDAVLVGEVVSTVCGKDASIVDVVLPGEPWKTRRCQLGQGYVWQPMHTFPSSVLSSFELFHPKTFSR